VPQTVKRGKTLLVDGPASVSMVSGEVEVFGFSLKDARRIVVREGKRLPFFVVETADFDISLGETAGAEEVDGDTVPPSWVESFEVLMGFKKKPVIAMVVGKVDSGKSSFCTYLINRLVSSKWRVAVLDGDLGQSDVGPPSTVGYAFVYTPLTELFNLEAENAFFVGVTSPSEAVNETIEGLVLMKTEVLGKAADFIVVNTDGWVEGEEAVKYKLQLAEKLEPDVVLCIQQEDELKPLLSALEKFVKTVVETPRAIRHRSVEKRKNLRELSYAKYLRDAKVKTWVLNQVRIEGENALPARQDKTRGLLLGMYDSKSKFLGIGVLREFNHVKRTLRALTSVAEKPAGIVVGKVRLDENLREAPVA
jgi:polynucleotide 5'-hydroxyl-kinase GRC3/NOL9